MGSVGDEVSLRFERGVEPPEEVIECIPEILEFVLGAIEGQTLEQVGGGDPLCRPGDSPDRSQHPAGNEPADQKREHRRDGQSDSRVDQKLMRPAARWAAWTDPAWAT